MIIDLDTNSRIIDILSLSKSIPVVQRCISTLESALTTIYIDGDISVATKEILGIYSLRVSMFKHLKLGEIEGGDTLVDALILQREMYRRLSNLRSSRSSEH
jgi:hypothetical protein